MIINEPTPQEFKNLSVQYLVQAVDHLYKTEFSTLGPLEMKDKETTDEFWHDRQGILGNSLIMLFLSIENYFKHEICKLSPLLLVAGDPKSWKTHNDRDFEELYIHQFDDLSVLYQEIKKEKLSPQTKDKFEDLRKKRNKYTHGVHRQTIGPEYVVDVIYLFLNDLWGTEWIASFKEVMLSEAIYGFSSIDEENIQLSAYFKFFEKYLTKRKFRSLIGMPQKGKRYHCPYCSYNNAEAGELDEKPYALIENNEEEVEVKCYVCGNYSEIKQSSCVYEGCNGNVIFAQDNHYSMDSDKCLTCNSEQNS